VLAVDLGTGGPKVGLVSLTGALAWRDHIAVTTTWSPDGGAEQDAEEWWTIIADAARRAMAATGLAAEQVAAVSVTGQWASTVPVDERGQPVGPCIMWMDSRGRRHTKAAIGGPFLGFDPRALAVWVRRTAGVPSTTGGDPISHMLHLLRDAPEIGGAARWFLEPVDYLSMRFTGKPAASRASMTAAWLTDNRHLDVEAYDADLVRRAGLDAAKLPPLVPTGSIIGPVLPEVAAELGISPEAQVVTGLPDLHSAAIGAGALGDYEAHMAISTTSWISCQLPAKKTDPFHQIATVPGVSPQRYLVIDNQDTAGRAFEWLRDGAFGGALSYDDLTAAAAKVPPGADRVIFTPWLAGERSPIDDRLARGGFHNLSLATTQGHLARAVLEGVAFNSRWLLEAIEKFTKRRLDPIRLIGGAGQSDLWCQIVADVFDRTIERVEEPLHANLRGAALAAGMALGAARREELHDLVRCDATFRPTPANRATYDALFGEFPKLYKAQKATFRALNRRA
jgi:xylulokinase